VRLSTVTPAMAQRPWFYAGHIQDRMSILLSHKLPVGDLRRYSRLLKVSQIDVVIRTVQRRIL